MRLQVSYIISGFETLCKDKPGLRSESNFEIVLRWKDVKKLFIYNFS